MKNDLCSLKQILSKYGQEHLLYFYDELEPNEKDMLVNQIKHIDFDEINRLYEKSKFFTRIDSNRITPIPYINKFNMSKEELEKYSDIGNAIIKGKKLAVITLAGGQGTRLGFKGPKGCYEIDIPPKKCLFEFVCDKLKNIHSKFNVTIPWYIMTSPSNDAETKKYFENHDYFDYGKENIKFFMQSTFPIISENGKIILDKIYHIKEGSNGNGDVFKSFNNAGLVQDLKEKNIDWIFIGGIDNILLNPADPLFIGLTVNGNYEVASKSLSKKDLTSSGWIFAKVDNKPRIIRPVHLSNAFEQDETGKYLYNQENMLAHLFSITAFEKLINKPFPYHMAYKKNDFINEEGMLEVPTKPNSFKFEKFIFDGFMYFDKLLLLQVNEEEEFAPIKSFTGSQTPETALDLYLKNNK